MKAGVTIFLYCFLFCSPYADAQGEGRPAQQQPPPVPTSTRVDAGLSERVNNLRGRSTPSIEGEYLDVEGSPFLADWLPGTVRLKNGKLVKDLVLKFDLHLNRLYFLRDNRAWLFADTVREFYLQNENGNILGLTYRNGFPAINKNTDSTYYEVVVDGKICLLQHHYRKMMKMNGPTANQLKGKMEDKHEWYVFLQDGNIVRIAASENSLLRNMPVYADRIRAVIKEYKPNLKTEDGMMVVFQQLNKTAP